MQLNVCLLSEKENPELGSFLLHLDCEFSHYSQLQELSLYALKNKIDLILLDEDWLKNEDQYRDLRTFLSRQKNGRLFILSNQVKTYKLSYSGVLESSDFNTLKNILEDSQSMKKIFAPKYMHSSASNKTNEEVVIEIEEEVDEPRQDVFTNGFVRIKGSQSTDQIGVALCDTLGKSFEGKRKGVFFKYLSTYCSLVAVDSFNFEQPKTINGMGLNFSKSKGFSPKDHFSYALEIPAFKTMVEKVFGHSEVESKILSAGAEVKGVLVYEKPPRALNASTSDEGLYRILDMANTKLESLKFQGLYSKNKIKDNNSGALLKEPFFEALQNEIIRSRRIFLPVSLFMIELDHFNGIVAKYNSERVSLLIKSLAQILHSSVRHNDSVGRLSEKRFGVLFPHMHMDDAVNKAGSLLKTVAQTQFFADIKDPLYCTLSVAIGTYPNHATSADELFIRLQNSLDHRNTVGEITKVDLPVGLQKDFEEFKISDLSSLQQSKTSRG